MTPEEAAQALYAVMPRAISRALLEEYGIEATEDQARDLTKEVLSLNLYWVRAAIDAHIPRQYRTVLFDRLVELIQQDWESFHQQGRPWADYLREFHEREAVYRPIGNEPGGDLTVAKEAGTILEDQATVSAEDRTKVLAFLVDHVPLDRYGEILDAER
jgi:hypothetical protein